MAHHPVNSAISDLVTDERVEERLVVMGAVVDEILEEYKDSIEGAFLNVAQLTSLIRSYFIDVERYKFFHNLDLVESYKIASYSTKWILRFHPIQYQIEEPGTLSNHIQTHLNEIFAVQYSFAVADLDTSILDKMLFNEILYTLHFRPISEDTLTLMFKAFGGSDKMVSG